MFVYIKNRNKNWCNESKWLKNDDKSLDTSSAPFEIEREYHKNKDCCSKFQFLKKSTKTHNSLNLFAELFNFNDDHKHIFLLLLNSLHAIAQYCQSHSLFTECECKQKEWKKRCYVNTKMVPCPYKDIYQCDDALSIQIRFGSSKLWIYHCLFLLLYKQKGHTIQNGIKILKFWCVCSSSVYVLVLLLYIVTAAGLSISSTLIV